MNNIVGKHHQINNARDSEKIDFVTIGFVKNELIELSRRIASLTKEPPFALFKTEEGVPEFKPG